MLRFVTKSDIWSLASREAQSRLEPEVGWHLKNIQDAVAIERLADLRGADIGEIGGGNSRLLPMLAAHNRCFNIDRFEGAAATGLGPKGAPAMKGVKPIIGLVGEPLDWPGESFDVLFSVSVVEHIRVDRLQEFFDDCRRLLRPGGRMLHLIDIYLADRPDRHVGARIARYREQFATWLEAEGPLLDAEKVAFSCAFATNPDDAMAVWNKAAPNLAAKRALAQSCALVMDGRKSAAA